MGGIVNTIGGAVGGLLGGGGGAITGALGGNTTDAVNGIGGLVGLGGGQGSYWQPSQAPQYIDPGQLASTPMGDSSQGISDLYGLSGGQSDSLNSAQAGRYGTGQINLSDVLGANSSQGMQNALATNPLSGTKLATDQVLADKNGKQLFGDSGTLDRTRLDEQRLASSGYSLQPEDFEAYGQASGNIARQFGQADQGLAQALADRGLSAPSGVAASQFAGQYGNKMEQLGQLQTQIAQNRMQMNQQRLSDTRNFLSNLNNQYQGAIQNQYGRNLSGVQSQNQVAEAAAQAGNQRYGEDITNTAYQNAQKQAQVEAHNKFNQGNYATQNGFGFQSAQNAQDREKPGLMDAISSGVFGGVKGGIQRGIGGGFGGGYTS